MHKPVTDPDSKKALLDAFDKVLKKQQEELAARRAEARRRSAGRPAIVTWIAVSMLLVTLGYLWLEQPQWMFPAPPPPESVAVREASLRIALANAARHVEHYRRVNGRLPASLEETGTSRTSIVYEKVGTGAYVLRGINGPVDLTLQSSDSLRPFVGKSFEIISRRSR